LQSIQNLHGSFLTANAMKEFIDSAVAQGRRPLVVVAGGTANAAFRQFKLPAAISTAYIAGFQIVQYQSFV